jgi:hypothetical protein
MEGAAAPAPIAVAAAADVSSTAPDVV